MNKFLFLILITLYLLVFVSAQAGEGEGEEEPFAFPCNGVLYPNGYCLCRSFYRQVSLLDEPDEACREGSGVCQVPSQASNGLEYTPSAHVAPLSFTGLGELEVEVQHRAIFNGSTDVQIIGTGDVVCQSTADQSYSLYEKALNESTVCYDKVTVKSDWQGLVSNCFVTNNRTYKGWIKVILSYPIETISQGLKRDTQQVQSVTEVPFTIALQFNIQVSLTNPVSFALGSDKQFQYFIREFQVLRSGSVLLVVETRVTEPLGLTAASLDFVGKNSPLVSPVVTVSECDSLSGNCRQNITLQIAIDTLLYCNRFVYEPRLNVTVGCRAGASQPSCNNEVALLKTTDLSLSLGDVNVEYCPQVQEIAFDFVDFNLLNNGQVIGDNEQVPASQFQANVVLNRNSESNAPKGTSLDSSESIIEQIEIVNATDPNVRKDLSIYVSNVNPTEDNGRIDFNFTVDLSPQSFNDLGLAQGEQYLIEATLRIVYSVEEEEVPQKKSIVVRARSSVSGNLDVFSNTIRFKFSNSPNKPEPSDNGNKTKTIVIATVCSVVGVLAVVGVIAAIKYFNKKKEVKGEKLMDNEF